MKSFNSHLRSAVLALALSGALSALSQTPQDPQPRAGGPPDQGGFPPGGGPGFDGQPGFGGGGFGPGGPGGRGGPGMQQEIKLVHQFDKDGDKRLNATERKAAREYLASGAAGGSGRRGGPGGRRGGFGPGGPGETPSPGRKLTPAEVQSFPKAPLYDPLTLRTFFLEFEGADWEKELAEFKNTDVEVPAKLTVDGKVYPDVGAHFHGMSSFMMVGEGQKRSIVLALDFAHPDQQLGGYNTINLLNSHEDSSFLHTVLSLQIAREYIPAPKANFVRVVINGESWGVYVNQQHFNKDFLKESFGSTKGARWKVPGSPGGRGSLAYLGDDPAQYKRIYEIKTKDDPKSWADLAKFTKVLNETPADQLENKLSPLLDIDGALKFLAWENVLVNGDGYWTRSSDYSIYEDEKGRFHIIPYDANETFSTGGGPGGRGRRGGRGGPGDPGGPGGRGFGGGPGGGGEMEGRGPGPGGEGGFGGPPDRGSFAGRGGRGQDGGPGFGPGGDPGFAGGPGGGGQRGFGRGGRGGPGGGGPELDPLVDLNDSSKPLLSKLLAVPALRTRYLGYVRDIAEKWLDWNKLGPLAEQYHALIREDVKLDTRKLESTEAFLGSVAGEPQAEGAPGGFGGGRGGNLKSFAERRRAYLLNHAEIKKLAN